MLQRAASNAYSWWWASHIRTKQSKWLEHNLQDMEDKVSNMLKIIDEDGDSFAKRAEMYFRKRPELINFVEESYRAYRALAERYDHISREMQNANRTIATVFPEQVQFAMDDEEEDNFPGELNPSLDPPGKPSKGFPPISKPIVPKIPKVPMKELKAHPTFISRKKHLKRTSSRATTTSSGLRKADALEEIDKLQKGILGLQTEKEFVKSSYENGLSKYWEIENQITEMQGRVCNLQDEFGVGSVIDDDEARKLMATSALNSCQRALIQLQEKQEQSAEEARIEHQRIKEAHAMFNTLRNEFLEKQTDRRKLPQEHESVNAGSEAKHLEHPVDSLERERHDMESIREKIRETLEVNSNTSLTATEMAEKIDELADKVIILETAVSSQNALVTRLRSETDELQAHIRSLEEDKETLLDGSDNMSSKLREMEDELHRVQNLNKSIEDQNHHLQTHFTEASCNIDHLSQKLQNIKPYEEDQKTGLFQELKSVPEAKSGKEFEEREDLPPPGSGSDVSKDVETEMEGVEDEVRGNFSNCIKAEGRNEEESMVKSNLSNKVEVLSERDKEAEQQNKDERQELSVGKPQFEQSDLPQLGSGLDVSEDVETEIEKRQDEVWENFSNWDKAEGGGGEEESIVKSNLSNRVEVLSEQDKEAARQNKDEKQELSEGPPQLEQSDLPHLGSDSEVSKDVETRIEKGEDHWETFFSELVKAEGEEESIVQSNLSNEVEVLSEQDKEPEQQNKDEKQDLLETVDNDPDNKSHESGTEEEEEQPNWRQLFLNGIDDREKILLGEYTSILRNFKEVKKKLSELEKKNRDSLFDSTMQIKELKNANTLKDEEIQSLRKKLNPQHLNPFLETISTEYNPSNQGWPYESVTKEDSPRFSSISSLNSNRQPLYVFLDDKYFDAAERNEELTAQRFPSSPTEHGHVSTIEEKIRTDIDDLLEENLEFWLKFSTSFHQIQKFETSIQDLQAELSNLKEKQEGSAKNQSLKSDARPIYKHLREIQTELKLWFEHNALLKDELRSRLSSLCNIQEELSRLSNAGSGAEMINLSDYQAAKFQGEVQNMKQENNKVAHELQAGLSRVNGLQVEIERTLSTMDDDFGFSQSKNQAKPSLGRSRIPLRSFLFGVKLMKQKPSIFSCMNPALQRQYSDLRP